MLNDFGSLVSENTREDDDYVNASIWAAAFAKDWFEYKRSSRCQRIVKALSHQPEISRLVESTRGRFAQTWIYPVMAVDFAEWLDPQFGLFVKQELGEAFKALSNLKGSFNTRRHIVTQNGQIYLFEGINCLKLGFSLQSTQRIKQLQRWDGELEIVVVVCGTLEQELAIHSILQKTGDVLADEWYPSHRKHEILNLLSGKRLLRGERMVLSPSQAKNIAYGQSYQGELPLQN